MSTDHTGGYPPQEPPAQMPYPPSPPSPVDQERPASYPSPTYSSPPPGPLPPPLSPNGNGTTPTIPPQSVGGAEPMSAIPYAVAQPQFPVNEPEPTPIPTPGVLSATQLPSVRIGLWGSSRAGKSTYLASLPIAGMQTTDPNGRWIVGGMTPNAVEYLVRGVDRLANHRSFPAIGQINESLTWVFHGPPPTERAGLFRRQPADGVQFALQLQDVPGEFLRTGQLSEDVVEHFANSQGLIYLFDPIGDAEERTRSFDFFFEMLQAVHARVREAGRLVRNRLPHRVAVCVTKFDEPEFFDAAVHAGWVNQQDFGSRLPVVEEKQRAAFFDWVCRGYRGGTATMICDAIQSFFHPTYVRYYATSAIGFRLNSNQVFDYHDYRNTEQVNNVRRIRATPRPLNVLEPLIDLERRISGRKR